MLLLIQTISHRGKIAKKCLKINFWMGEAGGFKFGWQIHLTKHLNSFVYQLVQSSLNVQNQKRAVQKLKKCRKKLSRVSKPIFLDAELNETNPRSIITNCLWDMPVIDCWRWREKVFDLICNTINFFNNFSTSFFLGCPI